MGWLVFVGVMIIVIIFVRYTAKKDAEEKQNSIVSKAKPIESYSKSQFAREKAKSAIFCANQSVSPHGDKSFSLANKYLTEAIRVDTLTHSITDKQKLLEIDEEAYDQEKRQKNKNSTSSNSMPSWLENSESNRIAKDMWDRYK
jgi:hypothetical protein